MSEFEKLMAEAEAARTAEVVNAIAGVARKMAYQRNETVYDLAEPVLVNTATGGFVVTKVRRIDHFEDGEVFVDIEGYGSEATAKGVARKGAVRAWRYLPSELASVF